MDVLDQFVMILKGLKEVDYNKLSLDIDRTIKTRFADDILEKTISFRSEKLDELVVMFQENYNQLIGDGTNDRHQLSDETCVILQDIISEMDMIICNDSVGGHVKYDMHRNDAFFEELDGVADHDFVYPVRKRHNRRPRNY